ncbi:MAG: acyl carrier protein [Lachnospiraceae bacterium]|nr:acyl carrier protein [Cuneatibacter sp.]MDD6454990.1 acyl carrier protein [Lachnospiraceae bacterium]
MNKEFDKLVDIISSFVSTYDKADITMDTQFVDDLGTDSLDRYEILMAVEEEYDIKIPDDAIENIQTVGDAVRLIEKAIG